MKVFISPLDINDAWFNVCVDGKYQGDVEGYVEATLVIDTSKKITITETDFDKIFAGIYDSWSFDEIKVRLKKELFGEKD